jgi:5-methylcytosine-specific restriction endonuclease McrA
MDAATRRLVRERASNRCEYCRIHQDDEPFFRLHVEHIVARQRHGSDDADNLALSCHHDNDHKGPNLSGIDPQTGQKKVSGTLKRSKLPHLLRLESSRHLFLGKALAISALASNFHYTRIDRPRRH